MMIAHLCWSTTLSVVGPVTVYTHGENGYPCIRIPSTLRLPNNTLLSFAAARAWTGDSCFPTSVSPDAKNFSSHVVKRSLDGGATWGSMAVLSHPVHGGVSPEGASLHHSESGTVIAIWQSDRVSNATTKLRLWTAKSADAGATWSAPAPLRIPQLMAANVTENTHISPASGIELRSGVHQGRLLVVLILTSGNVLDVVLYSDNIGETWSMSRTQLPHNGEAQVAEVKTALSSSSSLHFNGRSKLGKKPNKPYLRGVARSLDDGVSWLDVGFQHGEDSGISCQGSFITNPMNDSSLLFSHPNGSTHGSRSGGVLLRSDDAQRSWYRVAHATPEEKDAMFAYSALSAGASGSGKIGLTYETGNVNCTAEASACRIVYREIEVGP